EPETHPGTGQGEEGEAGGVPGERCDRTGDRVAEPDQSEAPGDVAPDEPDARLQPAAHPPPSDIVSRPEARQSRASREDGPTARGHRFGALDAVDGGEWGAHGDCPRDGCTVGRTTSIRVSHATIASFDK